MRADVPGLRLDEEMVDRVVDDHLAKTFPLLHWQVVLEEGAAQRAQRRTAGHRLLVELLRQKEHFAIERLFRMLGLYGREENFAQLYEGLHSEDRATRASSVELLEHALPARWRAAVLGLTDDVADADRLAAGAAFYQPAAVEYEALLAQLVDHQSDTVAALAAYHARELGLPIAAGRAGGGRPDGASRQRWLDALFAHDDTAAGGLRNAG
jgi:hypothetical protein